MADTTFISQPLYGFIYKWAGNSEICVPPHRGIIKDGLFVPENEAPSIDTNQLVYSFEEEQAWQEFMLMMSQSYRGMQAKMEHTLEHGQSLWQKNRKLSWREPEWLNGRR